MSDYPADRDLYDESAANAHAVMAWVHALKPEIDAYWAGEQWGDDATEEQVAFAREVHARSQTPEAYEAMKRFMPVTACAVFDMDRWQIAAERHDPDLYRLAATPVDPKPESAGVVRLGTDLVAEPLNPIAEAGRIRAEEDARGDRMAEYQARTEAKAQRVADEAPGWPALPTDTVTMHRSTLRDLVRAAYEDGAVGDHLDVAEITETAKDYADHAVLSATVFPQPDPTDDLPTLPANALRTWEG